MKLQLTLYSALVCLAFQAPLSAVVEIPNDYSVDNGQGKATTFNSEVPAAGRLNTRSGFFQNFGSNLRTCFTCHVPEAGWTMTPVRAQALFAQSQGTDPLFRTNDGSNSPKADVSTVEAKRAAYSMLLGKGVIRVGLPIPAHAEFTLEAADDPYHYASSAELSLFRRPLSVANVRFLADVMWDGRETIAGGDLDTMLGNQANNATLTHAATTHPLLDDEREDIVAFEKPLFLAQTLDRLAGALDEGGAHGGPEPLSRESGHAGGGFTLFSAWENQAGADKVSTARASIARGEKLFNTKPIQIRGVRGLNDVKGMATINGTCATCHDVDNVGGNSQGLHMDIGVAGEASRTPDLPLYTLRNSTTGERLKVSDPGRGLITGKWTEVGCFKVPGLRALSARAPYFHNGSAATLEAAVRYHDARFQIGLSGAEISDLSAFLGAL